MAVPPSVQYRAVTFMEALTKKFQVILGPDTADLAVRMGIHSGPVTAGVLCGERSRFHLFGDTMNTAARMESNGIRDRIQMSQETADLLNVAFEISNVVASLPLVLNRNLR